MPLKVRCKGCGKVLTVPDKARGKAVKCPGCAAPIRVPAGKKATAAAGKKRPVRSGGEADDPLAGLDLRRVADTRVRVCVKCGAEVDEEVIDCPECGHNVETGVLSEAMRKKLERKGPDPDEFWGTAVKGALRFVRQNQALVWRTVGYWVLFLAISTYAGLWFWALTQNNSATEPLIFFGGLFYVFAAGVTGWFWKLTLHIIHHTMSNKRDKPAARINFDFFESVALGIKAIAWQFITFFPLWLISGIVFFIVLATSAAWDYSAAFESVLILFAIVGGCSVMMQVLVFPLAMVHMSMPYTYKAWTPYHMGIALFKNFLPALFYFGMVVVSLLPVLAVAAAVVLVTMLISDAGYPEALFDISDKLLELAGMKIPSEAVLDRSWGRKFIDLTVVVLPFIFLVHLPISIIGAYIAVFLGRINGYIGHYFRESLDLVREQSPNVPCGFWVRYLAALVDGLIISAAMGLLFLAGQLLFVLFRILGLQYLIDLSTFLFYAAGIVFPWLYFAGSQSKTGIQGSLGKTGIGIIVTREDGKPLDFVDATIRFFAKYFLSGPLTLGAGCLMAGFTKKKQALHDLLCKTVVVWKGDDERNAIA